MVEEAIQKQRSALREANAASARAVVEARAKVGERAAAVLEQRREAAAEARSEEAARASAAAEAWERESAERRDLILQLRLILPLHPLLVSSVGRNCFLRFSGDFKRNRFRGCPAACW